MSATHIAGFFVRIEDRLIQRCALCGEKLIDVRLGRVETDVSGEPYPTWDAGAHVVIDDNNNRMQVHRNPAAGLPADSCLSMVEPGDD